MNQLDRDIYKLQLVIMAMYNRYQNLDYEQKELLENLAVTVEHYENNKKNLSRKSYLVV